jgi:hypothetical protein
MVEIARIVREEPLQLDPEMVEHAAVAAEAVGLPMRG